jgi:hypothetical protein
MAFSSETIAQSSAIQWQNDTLSMSKATAAKRNYISNIRGGGNANATEQINMPVDKLKFIMDACAANNVSEVSFVIIKVRAEELAFYKHHMPSVPDGTLLGSQMLVIKVSRSAFAGAAASGIFKPHPLMLSLAAAGLVQFEYKNAGIPFGAGDVYFSFGTICPPPTSCDTN